MFREMIRKKQQLTQEECVGILKKEKRGVLSVMGDEGYPYGFPVNHFYNEEDGKLYFHCGKVGHKLDSIKRCDKVSICVYDEGYRNDGEWALNIRSVIVFGRAIIVTDMDRIVDISRKLSYKFTENAEYIEDEITKYAGATLLVEITPEHMTGKLVNES
ncbi:MAG: pyridoxamine 5'-phosphate oxidase family protein [Lachnospiraceae bacterium]|nr:pyridoxamine 5'-phosphate oxidase family protein [Lachnospiraceae bacterium]